MVALIGISHNETLGRALGFTNDIIEAISGDYQNPDHFSDAEKSRHEVGRRVYARNSTKAALAKNRKYRDVAFAELEKHYSANKLSKSPSLQANFWNRFTDSFEIDIEDNPVMSLFKKSTTIDPKDYAAYMQSFVGGTTKRGPEALHRDCIGRPTPQSNTPS